VLLPLDLQDTITRSVPQLLERPTTASGCSRSKTSYEGAMMLPLLMLQMVLAWGAHRCTLLGGGMPSVTVTRGTGPGLPMMPCNTQSQLFYP
jgi:hypothetical protein